MKLLERDLTSGNNKRRWAAAAGLSEVAERDPGRVWPLVIRHGSSTDEDLRQAVATCLLEHILEHDFSFFPQLKEEVEKGNDNLLRTLAICWKFGEALRPANSRKWDDLLAAHGVQAKVGQTRKSSRKKKK